MRLDGTVALVTGAGSGIGRAIAIEAAQRGMQLALVGRGVDALRRTSEMLGSAKCVVLPTDITVRAERERLVRDIAKRFGRVGLLVNNAGLVCVGEFEHAIDADVERMVSTNLTAPMLLTRSMLALLRNAPQACVLNIGSMFGDIAFPYFASYSATKFALRGFSDALRREWAAEKINVTYAAPRATRTPAVYGFEYLVAPMKMKLDTPTQVACSVLDAVQRDARSVYPRGAERLFVLFQRIATRLIDSNLQDLSAAPDVRQAVIANRRSGLLVQARRKPIDAVD
jgi:short-subunit dehydrogenase